MPRSGARFRSAARDDRSGRVALFSPGRLQEDSINPLEVDRLRAANRRSDVVPDSKIAVVAPSAGATSNAKALRRGRCVAARSTRAEWRRCVRIHRDAPAPSREGDALARLARSRIPRTRSRGRAGSAGRPTRRQKSHTPGAWRSRQRTRRNLDRDEPPPATVLVDLSQPQSSRRPDRGLGRDPAARQAPTYGANFGENRGRLTVRGRRSTPRDRSQPEMRLPVPVQEHIVRIRLRALRLPRLELRIT